MSDPHPDTIFMIITPDQHRQLREAGFRVVPASLLDKLKSLFPSDPEIDNVLQFPGPTK